MRKLLRFLAAVALLIWMGCLMTLTFVVAPSLFGDQSGVVTGRQMAGEIIAPMLHTMYRIGWVAIPIAIVLILAIGTRTRPRFGRAIWIPVILLATVWAGELCAGGPMTQRLHTIRMELKAEYGAYDLAPKDNPKRAEFARLHGIVMMIALADLTMGMAAFFFVTQRIGMDGGRLEEKEG